MGKTKRNPALKVIGAILIVAGVITFIVSAVQLYDVQTTTTHWAEGFMQDYQARTNATNSIPCYIFMALAVVMVIAGIVMVCIKPKIMLWFFRICQFHIIMSEKASACIARTAKIR